MTCSIIGLENRLKSIRSRIKEETLESYGINSIIKSIKRLVDHKRITDGSKGILQVYIQQLQPISELNSKKQFQM